MERETVIIKSKRKSFWYLIGLVIVLIVLLVLFIVYRNTLLNKLGIQKGSSLGKSISIKVAQVEYSEIVESFIASSLIEPSSYVKIRAPLEGVISDIFCDIGDVITKNQELVKLENDELVSEYSVRQEIVRKNNDILENRKAELERMESLFARNLVAEDRLRTAKLAYDTANSDYEISKEQLSVAREKINKLTILSPIDGVVISVDANPGETIFLRNDILTTGVIDPVYAATSVSEIKFASIRLRQKATVVFDSYPDKEFTGEVEKIDSTIDPNMRTFKVYVKLSNSDGLFSTGMAGTVRFIQKRRALTIPSVSIINPAGLPSVFVVSDSTAHLRQIQVGIISEGKAEVISGLSEGEVVVTYGQLNLKDGDIVSLE